MDSTSKPQATPSSAELYLARIPSLSTSSSSGYSLPIRAPPTLDSDFQYSKKLKKSTSSYTSDSDEDYNSGFYESEGFLSGEDGFESASETPYANDETLGKSSVFEGNFVSRPFVNNPDEKEEEIDVSRPFVFDSDDDDRTSRNFVNNPDEKEKEIAVSRPFVFDSDDDRTSRFFVNNSDEKEKEIAVSRPFVFDSDDDRTSRIPMKEEVKNDFPRVKTKSVISMPIAQLSADSDDDSVSSLGVEDYGISGPVRVPIFVFVKELNSAPIVKKSELEREEEDELDFKTSFELEMDEELTSGDVIDGILGTCQEEGICVNDSVSVEAVEHEAIDVFQEAEAESSNELNYTVEEIKEVEKNFLNCNNIDVVNAVDCVKDKEVVIDGTETRNSLLSAASETGEKSVCAHGDDIAYESKETNLQGIELDVKGAETSIGSGAVTLNNQNFESDTGNQETDDEILDAKTETESQNKENLEGETLVEEEEGSVFNENNKGFVYENSDTTERMIGALEHRFDGQIVPTSDEEAETIEESIGKVLFDSAELTAPFKAATSTGLVSGDIMFSAANDSRIFSFERGTGLGSTDHSFKSTTLANAPADSESESQQILSEEDKRWLEKMQQIRVKFLRLVKRLGFSNEDLIVRQVLHQLVLAVGVPSSMELGLESAKNVAIEAENKNDLRFSLNILVIGKTGVGKSATINSIFGEEKTVVNAFEPGTNAVKEIVGTKDGVEIRVLDTPGFRSSLTEHNFNMKILLSIKRYMKKCPPDVVLYVDRFDSQTSDLSDLPLLKSITSSLSPSIWDNAIVTLTHAASTPPDGPSGSPISYEMLVAQRSQVIQKLIRHTVADPLVKDPVLMNPVSIVENHPCCKNNGGHEFLLPNGESWRPKLLLLCYSMQILSEINSLLMKREPSDSNKIFGSRMCSPHLSNLLLSLLQTNIRPKLSLDYDGDESELEFYYPSDSDSDEGNEDEYNQLPPFKPLRKNQITNLTKEQRGFFKEYDYRVKLVQKKQLRQIKNRSKDKNAIDDAQEMEGPSTVSSPLLDPTLPPSFDGDYPACTRYRYLESTFQILIRPFLNSRVWDHGLGCDRVGIDQYFAIANCLPAVMVAHVMKDKNLRKNKTAAGVSITFLGENLVTGLKIEDQLVVGERLVFVGTTGAVWSRSDLAYGSNLEVRVRGRDFPVGRDQSTMGLSFVWWKQELIWSCNLKAEFCVRRNSKMTLEAGLNDKGKGKISVKGIFSDQLQIALVGLLPIVGAVFRYMFQKSSEKKSVE